MPKLIEHEVYVQSETNVNNKIKHNNNKSLRISFSGTKNLEERSLSLRRSK